MNSVHAVQCCIHHKDTAITVYEALEKASVAHSGIWLSKSGMLGALPDGIVDDSTIIEVKCPFSARETPLHELIV